MVTDPKRNHRVVLKIDNPEDDFGDVFDITDRELDYGYDTLADK